jgi:hypothetical protein
VRPLRHHYRPRFRHHYRPRFQPNSSLPQLACERRWDEGSKRLASARKWLANARRNHCRLPIRLDWSYWLGAIPKTNCCLATRTLPLPPLPRPRVRWKRPRGRPLADFRRLLATTLALPRYWVPVIIIIWYIPRNFIPTAGSGTRWKTSFWLLAQSGTVTQGYRLRTRFVTCILTCQHAHFTF